MGSERIHAQTDQRHGPPRSERLRQHRTQLAVHSLQGASNFQVTGVQVDVIPHQPEQLATTKAEVERQDIERIQPIVARNDTELARLFHSESAVHLVPSTRDLGQLGDVALHQFLPYSRLQCVPQHGMDLLNQPVGRTPPAALAECAATSLLAPPRVDVVKAAEARVPDPLEEHPDVRAVQLVELLSAERRHDVHPDDHLVTLIRLGLSGWFHDVLQPVVQKRLQRPVRRLGRNSLIWRARLARELHSGAGLEIDPGALLN